MKSVILYSHPPESDGLSIQGNLLYRGMKENGENVMPCHLSADFEKEWIYHYFKPDVAIGVGYWGHTPDIVFHPQKFGVAPVPWLNADGWVANYHEVLSSLPLVLTTSEWVKKTYERDHVDTKNFVAMPVGFESNLMKPIPKSEPRVSLIRKSLGIAADEVMILTIGGDVTSKGAQEVFKALKLVDQEFKKWKYVCKAWGGPSVEAHHNDELRLIEELGEAKSRVRYLEGPLSHEFIPYFLNACDIYAAPSRLEGFGMIQMEAQACGIPVISINEMGPKEVIIHGETGFLANVSETVRLTEEWVYPHMGFGKQKKIKFCEPKIFAYRANVDEIAEYLLQLLTQPKLRQEMGTRARDHALKNFEYRLIAKRVTDFVKERLML